MIRDENIMIDDELLVNTCIEFALLNLLGFHLVKIPPSSSYFSDIKYRPVWTLAQDKKTKTPIRLELICPSSGDTKVAWPHDLNEFGVTLVDIIEYLRSVGAKKLPAVL